MNSNKLKIAIIGLGEQMIDNLLPSLLLDRHAVIVALCDISEMALKLGRDRFGIRKCYTSYQDMMEKEDLDLVVISSYPEIHYKIAHHAILLGIHVFVEKPPVTNLKQLQDLVGLARKQQIKTGVGMNFSYTDSHHILTDIIAEPDFGAIAFIGVEHISSKPRSPLWHLDSTIESFLLAQLIHPLDYMMSIGGRIKALNVHCSQSHEPFILQLMIDFENGIIGSLKSGSYYPRFRHEVEVISTVGNTVRIKDLADIEVTRRNSSAPFNLKSKQCSIHYTPSPLKGGYAKAGYENEFNAFFKHLLHDKAYNHSFEDMIPVYQAMEDINKQIEGNSAEKSDKSIQRIKQINIHQDLKAEMLFENMDSADESGCIAAYELALKNYFNAGYCLAVSSGTAGLIAALRAIGIMAGDEIITSPAAPLCTAFPIMSTGGKLVFSDINKENFGLDIDGLKQSVSKKTRAIVEVPMWGYATDAYKIKEFASSRSIPLVFDLAHCIGTSYQGKALSHFCDIALKKKKKNKIFSTGEGGFLLTDNEEYYNKALLYSRMGSLNGRDFGLNYRLSPILAEIGIEEIIRLPMNLALRNSQSELICDSITHKNVREIEIVPSGIPSYQRLLLKTADGNTSLSEYLSAHGIPSDMKKYNIKPLYKYEVLHQYKANCPNAEQLLAIRLAYLSYDNEYLIESYC